MSCLPSSYCFVVSFIIVFLPCLVHPILVNEFLLFLVVSLFILLSFPFLDFIINIYLFISTTFFINIFASISFISCLGDDDSGDDNGDDCNRDDDDDGDSDKGGDSGDCGDVDAYSGDAYSGDDYSGDDYSGDDCSGGVSGPVCEEYGVWLHADGAYGGNSFICPELRGPMKGIQVS